MGFMEIFGLIAMFIGIDFLIWIFASGICKINHQKHTDNKIKIKKQSMGLYYAWLILSPFNTFNMFMQMSTASERGDLSREKAYFYMGIYWLMLTVGWLIMVIFGRYGYVSENYIIIYDIYKTKLNHDDCRYKIIDDTLEIYYKKREVPFKYRIVEKREELIKMLDDNYKPYEL